MLAVLRLPFAFLPQWWNLGFELLGTLLVIYGFYIEPFRIDVHKESFLTPRFAAGQKLSLIHLGDLHIERITRRETEILKDIQDLHPDLILFSGDILNLSYLQDARAQSEAVHFLSQLQAPLGVYAVSGSPAVDLPELFPKLIGSTPIHWLNDQAVRIDQAGRSVTVYGLDCSHDPEKDEAALRSLLASSPLDPSAVNILLHHSPDLAPNASQYAFDLQLSGHTHGGQVRLPFYGALVSGSLYKKAFEAGRYLVNGMTLYVTRGLGMEGAVAPRVRFLCPPEMIVWNIHNESKK
jgi:predicted MPP superfamily phosphohydrolase